MGTVNMAVDFGGVKMQNPINTAAGTFGYGWQFQNFFDVSQLGAITTKGCAAEPWPGNPAPRMAEIPGGMINSVGLQNPGVAAFAVSPVLGSNSCPRTAARSSVRLPATPLTSLSAHSRCMSSCAPGLPATRST